CSPSLCHRISRLSKRNAVLKRDPSPPCDRLVNEFAPTLESLVRAGGQLFVDLGQLRHGQLGKDLQRSMTTLAVDRRAVVGFCELVPFGEYGSLVLVTTLEQNNAAFVGHCEHL